MFVFPQNSYVEGLTSNTLVVPFPSPIQKSRLCLQPGIQAQALHPTGPGWEFPPEGTSMFLMRTQKLREGRQFFKCHTAEEMGCLPKPGFLMLRPSQ